jgi:hypothetical protein
MGEFEERYYQDKIFCQYFKTCKKGTICCRAETCEVIISARNERLKIQEYDSRPPCYKSIFRSSEPETESCSNLPAIEYVNEEDLIHSTLDDPQNWD